MSLIEHDPAEGAAREIEKILQRDAPSKYLRPPAPKPEPEPVPEQPVPESSMREKIDHTLLPVDALEEVSRTLMHGKERFGAWNWAQHPLTYTEYLAKAHRHILAFQRGEDIDPGTGRTHIACAICDLMFLQSHMIQGLSTDDRFKR
jgi:dATP/dGTP diphosphohydrolase